jgi:hypothetical protein
MTARTRPRAARQPRARRQKRFFRGNRFFRAEVVGIAVAALTLASLPWLIDIGDVGRETRDWVVRTFGLGIFILAALSVAGGIAIARRSYEQRARFARRRARSRSRAGVGPGLSSADWRLGGVDLARDAWRRSARGW